MSKTNERIKWLDIIKGICISFVMLSHSYSPDDYRRFFTPFFLSMFFFASYYWSSRLDFMLGRVVYCNSDYCTWQ